MSFLAGGWGPAYDRQGRSSAMEQVICKTATADCFGSGGAAAMALRAACSGIEIQDYTHRTQANNPNPLRGDSLGKDDSLVRRARVSST